MKSIQHFFLDLRILAKIIAYSLILFYISQLIWPYISLPFSNTFDSHGMLTKIQFNSLNNSVRYFFTLFFIFIGTSIAILFPVNRGSRLMRLLFIVALVISYFIIALVHPKGDIYKLDFLHDGEQVGNAALSLQGRSLYSGVFFFHGAFNDPLIAVSSFKIFGTSIGSYLLLTSYLHLISFFLFFVLLSYVIKNDFIFYAAAIWFYNLITQSLDFQVVNFAVAQIRDIGVWLTLLTLWFFLKERLHSRLLGLFLGFLASFQYFISLDRGFYLSFLVLLTAIVNLFLTSELDNGQRIFKLNLPKTLVDKNLVATFFILLGFFAGFLIQIPLLGLNSFLEFLKFTFLVLPKFVGNFNEMVFPSYSESQIHWFPILMTIFNGLFILFYFFINRLKNPAKKFTLTSPEVYILLVFIFSIVFFRSSITRTDLYHLFYGITIIFFVTFLILDNIFISHVDLKDSNEYMMVRNFTGIIVVLWLLFNFNVPLIFQKNNYKKSYNFRRADCSTQKIEKEDTSFVNLYLLDHLKCVPYKDIKDIKLFFTLPQITDSYWISEKQQKIIDFLNENSTREDYVFVYSNEPAYYYFLKSRSPTRFAQIWLADSKIYREEVLNDLQRNKPKFIVYSTGNWPERVEDMSMRERFPDLDAWIVKMYPRTKDISGAMILYQ